MNRNTTNGRARDLAAILTGRKWGSVARAFSLLMRAAGNEADGGETGDDVQALEDLKSAQHSAAKFAESVRLGDPVPTGFNPELLILILTLLPYVIEFIESLRKAKK